MNIKKYERIKKREAVRKGEKEYSKKKPEKRDKYSNKSPGMRIFHRYTGFIVIGVFLCLCVIGWYWYDSQLVFFENYACESIFQMNTPEGKENLTAKEQSRFFDILMSCKKYFPEQYALP